MTLSKYNNIIKLGCRYYILICGFGFIIQTSALAQYNNLKYDTRRFNLGFSIGMNLSDVDLHYGKLQFDRQFGAGLQQIVVKTVPGLNLGIISNLKLTKNLDLRLIPAVSLQQKNFQYVFTDTTVERKLEAAYMQVPLFLKFKSNYYRHYRVYVMTGTQFSMNLVSDQKVKDDPNLVKITKFDWSWEFAFGIDIYADRVKLSPEIRYSLGMKNIYVSEYDSFGPALTLLGSQAITLSLHFE